MTEKLYLLIIAVCCVQICYGAPTTEDNSSEEMTDEDITRFRNLMLAVPGVKNETIEKLESVLSKFKQGTTSAEKTDGTVELFVLFLTMGNNNLSKDEWKILLTTEDEGPDDESDEFGLGRLENELKKKASAEETEKIMKIIRKFKDDSAPEQQKQAVLDLIMYGIAGLIQRSVNKV